MEDPHRVHGNVQASCDFCHDALDNGHYLSVNPFGDPDKTWDLEALGIPLVQGSFTCVSCHDPHEAGVLEHEIASKGSDNSKRLRLGGGNTMMICRGCHADR
ncbi:MAG: hypothetical protein RRA32_07655 [bacterium]|nr:hypothetical protein [bacterium]